MPLPLGSTAALLWASTSAPGPIPRTENQKVVPQPTTLHGQAASMRLDQALGDASPRLAPVPKSTVQIHGASSKRW